MTNVSFTGNSSKTTVSAEIWYEIPGIWAVLAMIIFSIIGDILTLVIIKRTRTLKSYTGDLFISQVSSCIPRQLLSVVLIFTYRRFQNSDSLLSVRYTLRLLTTGFQGITSHTLAAIGLNLYFAVCHSTVYRTRMSRLHVLVFIPLCWIINIALGLCPLASEDPLFVSLEMIQAPSYKGSAFWVWLFIVIFVYILPAVITVFAFIMIWSHSRRVRPLTSVNIQFRDKFLLAKAVVGLAACFICLWSLMHLFRALQAKYEPEGSEKTTFRRLASIPYFLNLIYDAFKIGVYLLVYKPIRLTVIELCKKMRRKSPRITTVEALSRQERVTSHV